MATFAFRFHPLYRVLAAPFGVMSGTALVEVADGHLTARFGPWILRTPLSNVVGCQRTGPFSVRKTAGPARLSMADGGLTFATNAEAGLCLCFREPVAGLEPFGVIRHPALTLTVADLADLERSLADGAGDADTPELCGGGARAESPWAIAGRWARWPAGMALATARYLATLGATDRHYETRPGKAPDLGEPGPGDPDSGDDVQGVAAGVGSVFERTYRVRIRGAGITPEALLATVASDFNRASPVEVAEFCERDPDADGARPGTEYRIRMPGPWDGPVRVVKQSATSVRLATLEGHMEAGQIEFRTAWVDEPAGGDSQGDLFFEIRSVARSGDRAFGALYERVALAREAQLHMWVHFLRRVGELSGGEVRGRPEVRTIRYEG